MNDLPRAKRTPVGGLEPRIRPSDRINDIDTESGQNRANTKQINALTDSAPSAEKQIQTPPEHSKNTSLHEKCVTCVHQGETLYPDDLREVIEVWEHMPDAVKAGIIAMVRASRQE